MIAKAPRFYIPFQVPNYKTKCILNGPIALDNPKQYRDNGND